MISLHVMKVVDFSVTLLYSQLGVALPLGQLLWHRRYTVFVTYGQASLCLYVTSLSFCFYLICPSRIAKRFESENLIL